MLGALGAVERASNYFLLILLRYYAQFQLSLAYWAGYNIHQLFSHSLNYTTNSFSTAVFRIEIVFNLTPSWTIPSEIPAISAFSGNGELRGTDAPLKINLPLPLIKGKGIQGIGLPIYRGGSIGFEGEVALQPPLDRRSLPCLFDWLLLQFG